MASDGRSLAGISISQWMKNRTTDSLPAPDPDDNFLFIPYPKLERRPKSPLTTTTTTTTTIEERTTVGQNYINHTEPCKQFLKNNCQPVVNKPRDATVRVKSNGTDDGFKGEAARCGSSVVRVAHQMVSGKLPHATMMQTDVDSDPLRPAGFNPSHRRGSKSLPTTPLGSPKGRRRAAGGVNKYFTGAFMDGEAPTGHWLLQSLLGKRDLSRSIGFIAEEGVKDQLHRTASEMYVDVDQKTKSKSDLHAKPSELREMNFWSPTSM